MVITKQTERTHADNAVRYGTEVSDRKETEMDKAIIDHKTELQNLSDYFLKLSDAVKRGEMSGEEAVKACLEYADRKTEPSNSEIPNNFDKDINVRSKDEPQTDCSWR